MNLQHTRATRASLHLKMAESLDVKSDDTCGQNSAFIEAVCWSESPGTTLLLAECLEDQIDRQTANMGVQHVIVDPSALYSAGYDSHTVCSALRLAGLVESKVAGKTVWSTAKNPNPTLPRITISGDILQGWLADE